MRLEPNLLSAPPARSLRLLCTLMKWLSLLCAVVAAVVSIFTAGFMFFAHPTIGLSNQPQQQMSLFGCVILAAIILFIGGGLSWGLFNAAKLFSALRRGSYFAVATAKALRNFAIGVTIYKAPVTVLLMLMSLPGGSGFFTKEHGKMQPITDGRIGLVTWDGPLTLVFLGAIILFAAVMKRAAQVAENAQQLAAEADRLAEENAAFV